MNERTKELAEQCGYRSNPDIYDRNQSFDIEKFAELVRQDEREACAKLCEEISDSAHALWKVDADPTEQGRDIGAEHCAQAIRVRGEK
jgi:hypothetical protein